MCGVVERVNKLVYVRSLRSRFVLFVFIFTIVISWKFTVRGNVVGVCLWVVMFGRTFDYVDGLRLFCARYKPETGDIIVGRVVEVRRKKF